MTRFPGVWLIIVTVSGLDVSLRGKRHCLSQLLNTSPAVGSMPAPISPCLNFPQPTPVLLPASKSPGQLDVKITYSCSRAWPRGAGVQLLFSQEPSSLQAGHEVCWVGQEACKLFLWVVEFLSSNVLQKLAAEVHTAVKPSGRRNLREGVAPCTGPAANGVHTPVWVVWRNQEYRLFLHGAGPR